MDISAEEVIPIARKAGQAIMAIYADPLIVEHKDDQSPLTEADKRSNAVIVEALTSRFPDIPILSEETKQTEFAVRTNWQRFWLVDPLDGTKEFIKRNGEFTVNIALMQEGQPLLGVVYAPARQLLWCGHRTEGSFRVEPDGRKVRLTQGVSWKTRTRVRVVASRSHMDASTMQFVEDLKKQGKQVDFVSSGSSLKFCLVAEGSADVYPRFGPTMEWDTAAGQAVVEGAGGRVVDWLTGRRLAYNKEQLLNPAFLVEFP